MSATSFADPGDVVNISFAVEDYPYAQDDPPAPPRQSLQGRVIVIDSIGIVFASNGDNIMPSFENGRDELTLPADGTLFPWAAIKQVSIVRTGAQYELEWREHRAKETVFANANDTFPASNREYREWAGQQDPDDLAQRIRAAIDAEPPLS
ncbi:hypothetical protein [Rathayibacter rathayi]|uniref:hypothetical protein n=1 Tax=Rathayibacter rathayi TaxID=33887 RepID=UPI000BD05F07|nr:hypothetical protein [Rathayibacter rathayi]MWV76020.1 hypothetical protein [Rathayibacter rathayi NCPPB 2980 = VKM Ac-1601]PPF41943.1 hypothetical protein C5C08_15565 [Rathayibacter rathayi]PPF74689.1 hypothetical protein C5C14_15435 [Rathayibacter rathayi]PPG35934.1 hypothetical protein C5C20_15705 [Rathayibacter rathayi]PPG74139.1 hypothetical protein C5C15_15420 [Rathayibacter rathayi]